MMGFAALNPSYALLRATRFLVLLILGLTVFRARP